MEKTRTTIYIESDLINLAKLENLNVSDTVSNLLRTYLSTDSTEQIDMKIGELEKKLFSLRKRKHDMIQRGIREERKDGMNDNILSDIQKTYRKRREQGQDKHADEIWITSPRNIQKCRILCKEPLSLLAELEKWYDDTTN